MSSSKKTRKRAKKPATKATPPPQPVAAVDVPLPPTPPSLASRIFTLGESAETAAFPSTEGRLFSRTDWFAFLACFLVPLIAYFFTMAPTVTLEDSGELAVAGDYMGVPHPPGYPIWTLLAWFFQWIFHWVQYNGHPNPAWGITFMSAFFGALACGCIGMLISRSGRHLLNTLDNAETAAPGLIRRDWRLSALGFVGTFVLLGLMLYIGNITGKPEQGGSGLRAGAAVLGPLVLWALIGYVADSIHGKPKRGFPTAAQSGSTLYGVWLALPLFCALWVGNPIAKTVVLLAVLAVPLLDWLSNTTTRRPTALSPLTKSILPFLAAFGGATLLAFSPVMWSQSVIIEVYSLNAFFAAIILLLTYAWMCRPDNLKLLLTTSFLFGLGLTNHQSLLFFMLFLLVAIAVRDKALFREAALVICAGLTIYLFLKASEYGDIAARTLGPDHSLADQLEAQKARRFFVFLGLVAGAIPTLYYALRARWVCFATTGAIFWGFLAIFLGGFGNLMDTTPLSEAEEAARTSRGILALGFGGIIALSPLAFWFTAREKFQVWSKLYMMFGCVVVGLSFHAYMPIASEQNPGMNWAYPRKLAGFKHAVTRGQFEAISPAENIKKTVSQLRGKIPEDVTHPLQRKQFIEDRFLFFKQLGAYFYNPDLPFSMPRHFGWGFALLGLIPLLMVCRLPWHMRTWFTASAVGFLAFSVLFLVIQNPTISTQDLWIKRVQYIQAHAVYALWMAYGFLLLSWLLIRLSGLAKVILPIAGMTALVAMPAVPIYKNWKDPEHLRDLGSCDMNGHDFGWQFGYYQIMGAKGITEELGPEEPRLPNPSYPPEMEANAVFFGGTDPGRFVPTYMLYSAKVRADLHLITQNALADNTFMNITRDLYGDRVWIPALSDSNAAFREYVQDVESGKIDAGADVDMSGGRVSVQGVGGVMKINAKLCRAMWERNKDRHAFYVEESYPIPWMAPYLTPHGLIMKLNPEPVPTLSPQQIKDDFEFWDWYVRRLTNTKAFSRDLSAQKSFSKLRGSLAGLYESKGHRREAERAYIQALELYTLSPEANVRLVNVYQSESRYEEAKDLLERWKKQDGDNPLIDAHLYNNEQYAKIYREVGPLEAKWKANPMDIKSALTLMSRYNVLRRIPDVDRVGRDILNNPRIGGQVYVQLARHFTTFKRYALAREALARYERSAPGKYTTDIERAALYLETGELSECFKAMAAAIRLEPIKARDAIRADSRFEKLRAHPRYGASFSRLIPAKRPGTTRPSTGGNFGGFRTP